MKRTILIIIVTLILLFSSLMIVFAQGEEIVSLGANLTGDQRDKLLELFIDNRQDVKIIQVTNEEERAYLKGLISEEKIGTRAISSVYVKRLEKGEGITIETYNISWVTGEMYANAMVTAGVEDAKVVVAAPFQVSGTAALTGIMKAFEEVSGKEISESAKKTANEELVVTGDLGEIFGKDKAAALIKRIKERIIKEDASKVEDIRRIIQEVSLELKINLSKEQLDRLVDLMKKIKGLNLNVNKLISQLDNLVTRTGKLKEFVEKNRGFFDGIIAAIQNFFKWLMGLFSKA